MRRILHKLMRVPKTPMAHIQPLRLAASNQILRVEGRVLWRDAQIAQHDVADILRAMHWRASGRAVLGRGDGGWEGEGHLAVGWREGVCFKEGYMVVACWETRLSRREVALVVGIGGGLGF